MNNQRIAQELVKIAKSLVAKSDLPMQENNEPYFWDIIEDIMVGYYPGYTFTDRDQAKIDDELEVLHKRGKIKNRKDVEKYTHKLIRKMI